MMHKPITRDMLIADVLEQQPQSMKLFFEKKLGCVGCAMALYCTVSETCHQYDLNVEDFLRELEVWQTAETSDPNTK